jgi:hypothetical protein
LLRSKQTPYKIKASRKYRKDQTISKPDSENFCELQTASFEPVMWICIGFNADPDPAFYLNADPDTDPDPRKKKTMCIQADPDPDPDQTFESEKIEFYMKNLTVLKVGKRSKKIPYLRRYKSLFGRKPGLFVNFGLLPCSWIRFRLPNTDPDPRYPHECGSRWIRIYNTALNYP